MKYSMWFAFVLAILVGCGNSKNPTSFVQPDEPAGKLVVSSTKAPTSPLQVVPIETVLIANNFNVLAHFVVLADNFKDVEFRFSGSSSVRGENLTTLFQDREHPERTAEWPNQDFFIGGSGIYDVFVKGYVNESGRVTITMTADIRFKGGWQHTFKAVSTVAAEWGYKETQFIVYSDNIKEMDLSGPSTWPIYNLEYRIAFVFNSPRSPRPMYNFNLIVESNRAKNFEVEGSNGSLEKREIERNGDNKKGYRAVPLSSWDNVTVMVKNKTDGSIHTFVLNPGGDVTLGPVQSFPKSSRPE